MSLLTHIKYCIENVPYYQNKYGKLLSKISIDNWKSLIEPTFKRDLALNNQAFIGSSQIDIREIVSTSGTEGDPVFVYLSQNDLDRLAQNECFSYQQMGLKKGEQIIITTTLDKRFMAGSAYYLGAIAYGLNCIRTGPGALALQWETILQFQVENIIAIPSFLVQLIEYAQQNDIDYRKSPLRKALCIGIALYDENMEDQPLMAFLRKNWPELELFSSYASTEIATAFTESTKHLGLEQNPKLCVAEVIHENGKEVQVGEIGELIVTPLQVTGTPLLRYATGDLVKLVKKEKDKIWISGVIARKNQLIKYKGTSIYPPVIENILRTQLITQYQIVIQKDHFNEDIVLIKLSTSLQTQKQELERLFRSKLRVLPQLEFIPSSELSKLLHPEKSRKAQFIKDIR